MINAIIFSKDRASQLRLLLYSIQKNAPHAFNLNVIYTSSNEEFKQGYEKLKDEFSSFSIRIKNIISTWNLNENTETWETIADEISEEFNSIFKHESIKNELENIKTFVSKHPEIKKDNLENISDENIEEFKSMVQSYNQKLLSLPDFINCVKKIETIGDKEDKKKILEIVMSKIKNSIM